MKEKREKVPFFKSWNHWYVFVLLFLIVLVGFFYFFTKHFS